MEDMEYEQSVCRQLQASLDNAQVKSFTINNTHETIHHLYIFRLFRNALKVEEVHRDFVYV